MMNRYEAGKDPVEEWGGETRDWAFPLLENARYRQRLEVLAGVELTRRAGCEPCLRALVLDQWTPETLHHVGWCDSCRKASIALGKIPAGAAGAAGGGHRRRRALIVALIAGMAIAAPLAGSQLIGGGGDNRGGVAQPLPGTTASTTPGTTPTTTPGTTPTTTPGTTPTTTATTPATTGTTPTTTGPSTTPTTTGPAIDPTPRSKPAARGHGAQALPHTT